MSCRMADSYTHSRNTTPVRQGRLGQALSVEENKMQIVLVRKTQLTELTETNC